MVNLAELEPKALKLPENDRLVLAARLLLSVEPPADQVVEEAWSQEIQKRGKSSRLTILKILRLRTKAIYTYCDRIDSVNCRAPILGAVFRWMAPKIGALQ